MRGNDRTATAEATAGGYDTRLVLEPRRQWHGRGRRPTECRPRFPVPCCQSPLASAFHPPLQLRAAAPPRPRAGRGGRRAARRVGELVERVGVGARRRRPPPPSARSRRRGRRRRPGARASRRGSGRGAAAPPARSGWRPPPCTSAASPPPRGARSCVLRLGRRDLAAPAPRSRSRCRAGELRRPPRTVSASPIRSGQRAAALALAPAARARCSSSRGRAATVLAQPGSSARAATSSRRIAASSSATWSSGSRRSARRGRPATLRRKSRCRSSNMRLKIRRRAGRGNTPGGRPESCSLAALRDPRESAWPTPTRYASRSPARRRAHPRGAQLRHPRRLLDPRGRSARSTSAPSRRSTRAGSPTW